MATPTTGHAEKIVLQNWRAPGDLLAFECALHSLHETYPGRFDTAIDCYYPEVFCSHPHATKPTHHHTKRYLLDYTPVANWQQGCSFPQAYCIRLGEALRLPLAPTCTRPHIYQSPEEQRPYPGLPDRYVVVNAGLKDDFTLKHWPYYQEVVSGCDVPFVQIGLAPHNTGRLKGAIDLVGQTSIRQLFQVVVHAAAGLGPITFLQHICAAFSVPYVAILGGREPVEWVSLYPNQITLTGNARCSNGCWKARLKKLHDGSSWDSSICNAPGGTAARCMEAIKPNEVIRILQDLTR